MFEVVFVKIGIFLTEFGIVLRQGHIYVKQKYRKTVVRVVDGVVDGGSREETAFLTLKSLLCHEEDSLVGVPVLIEVTILFVFEQK